MTGQAVRAVGMANIADGFTFGVKVPAPVAALAIRMIRGHHVSAVNRIVAIRALISPHTHGSRYGLGASRTDGLPSHRSAGQDQERAEQNRHQTGLPGRGAPRRPSLLILLGA